MSRGSIVVRYYFNLTSGLAECSYVNYIEGELHVVVLSDREYLWSRQKKEECYIKKIADIDLFLDLVHGEDLIGRDIIHLSDLYVLRIVL